MAQRQIKSNNVNRVLGHHKGYYFDSKKHNKLVQEPKYNFNNKVNNKDFYSSVKCPKCNGNFALKITNTSKMHYECKKCDMTMSFNEYQKRYINLNWFKTVDLGIKLYSWDSTCPNCGNMNPCISYCINQDFGSEDLCLYKPLLLGSVMKLDNFIMKFCPSISLFPDENQELAATIICTKCDAPYSHSFIMNSFLSQKIFDVEFVIKKDVLKNMVNLKVTDITKLISQLELMQN